MNDRSISLFHPLNPHYVELDQIFGKRGLLIMPESMYDWFAEYPYLSFLLIYVMIAFVYNKVFRTRRLPLLKALIVYVLLGVGTAILLFFQIIVKLPIIPCVALAIFLMFLVRVRYFVEERRKKQKDQMS
nr:YlaH-like family protein [Paenibacillus larvae]